MAKNHLAHRGRGRQRSTKEGAPDRRVTLCSTACSQGPEGWSEKSGTSQRLRGALGPPRPSPGAAPGPPRDPWQPGGKPTPARAGSRDSGLRAPAGIRATSRAPSQAPTRACAPRARWRPRHPPARRRAQPGTEASGGAQELATEAPAPGAGIAERAAAAGRRGLPVTRLGRAHLAWERPGPAPRPVLPRAGVAERGLRGPGVRVPGPPHGGSPALEGTTRGPEAAASSSSRPGQGEGSRLRPRVPGGPRSRRARWPRRLPGQRSREMSDWLPSARRGAGTTVPERGMGTPQNRPPPPPAPPSPAAG